MRISDWSSDVCSSDLPIVCQMHEGWDALPREYISRRPDHARGSHGYDTALPSMRALFVSRGAACRQGVEIPAVYNVAVHPLMARLLGIAPASDRTRVVSGKKG